MNEFVIGPRWILHGNYVHREDELCSQCEATLRGPAQKLTVEKVDHKNGVITFRAGGK